LPDLGKRRTFAALLRPAFVLCGRRLERFDFEMLYARHALVVRIALR
jgi:hypothetical protein